MAVTTLELAEIPVLEKGDTHQLVVELVVDDPSSRTNVSHNTIYTYNRSAVMVDSRGLLTAKASGLSEVTAAHGNLSATRGLNIGNPVDPEAPELFEPGEYKTYNRLNFFEVGGQHLGTLDPSSIIMRFAVVHPFTLPHPKHPTGFSASAEVAPATEETVLEIRRNMTVIGTVTFAVGSTTGVVSIPASAALAQGDVLKVMTTATVDAELAALSMTFYGEPATK